VSRRTSLKVTESLFCEVGYDEHCFRTSNNGEDGEEIKQLLSLDRTRDRARIRVLASQRLDALACEAEELADLRRALQGHWGLPRIKSWLLSNH